MEQNPRIKSPENVERVSTPESGVNKYFQQEQKEILSREEVRSKIASTESRLVADIAGHDELRGKLGLPPATNEELAGIPAFAQNLNNLRELRLMEKQHVSDKISEVKSMVESGSISKQEEVSEVAPETQEQVVDNTQSIEDISELNINPVIVEKGEEIIDKKVESKQGIDWSKVTYEGQQVEATSPVNEQNIQGVQTNEDRAYEVFRNKLGIPTQDIDTAEEILQPQVIDSASTETVPEIKTEEVLIDQTNKEQQVVSPENMEPVNTLDQVEEIIEKNTEEVEDVTVPITEQSLNNTEQKEGSVESMEAEAVYVESVKNFTNSYKSFFENLLRYNESTLQKNGEESTDSILYGGDIDAITKDLDEVMGKINNIATAKIAMEHMVNINAFLMDNLFPVKSGMSSASVEGYDFLGKSIDEIGASLVSFYGTLKASKQEGSVQEVATQLSESLGQLKDLQERKLGHLNDYLSR